MRATIRDDLHGRGSEGSNGVEPRWTRAPGAMVAGAVAASFPLVVWLADAGGVGPGAAAPMGSHVAATVLALVVALVLLAGPENRVSRGAARVIAAAVVVAGALALWQHVPAPVAGRVTLFFHGDGGATHARVEPISALAIALMGLCLALHDLRSERLHRAAEVLALAVFAIAFKSLFEHAFGMDNLYGLVGPAMPVQTALPLLVLAAGTAALRTRRGWSRVLVDPGTAGVTVRRLIPVSIVVPFLVGWLTHLGVTRGLLSPATGLTLLVGSMGVLFVFAVGWTTRELHLIDRERTALLRSERLARDAAETASRAKSDVLGVVSHELRTPLNSVIAYADLLESGVKGSLNSEQLRYVERIRIGGSYIRSMIDEILELTRARSGSIRAEMKHVDAVALAREALAMVHHQAAASTVDLCTQLPSGPMAVHTDPEKVLHVLVNFLGNAFKFTEEGRVGLRLRRREDRIVYEVWDTGPGIPKDDRERIFQEFTQLEPGGAVRKGAGLGLAISRSFAETVGGSVELDSWVGRGSVFRLLLPAGEEAPHGPERGGELAPPRPGGAHGGPRPRSTDPWSPRRGPSGARR